MRCIECGRLQAVDGQSLPDEQRRLLKSRSEDAFLWPSCSKDVVKLSHGQPRVLEQVLSERRCESYLSLNGARRRERPRRERSSGPPNRLYSAIVVLAMVTALTASGIGLLLSL